MPTTQEDLRITKTFLPFLADLNLPLSEVDTRVAEQLGVQPDRSLTSKRAWANSIWCRRALAAEGVSREQLETIKKKTNGFRPIVYLLNKSLYGITGRPKPGKEAVAKDLGITEEQLNNAIDRLKKLYQGQDDHGLNGSKNSNGQRQKRLSKEQSLAIELNQVLELSLETVKNQYQLHISAETEPSLHPTITLAKKLLLSFTENTEYFFGVNELFSRLCKSEPAEGYNSEPALAAALDTGRDVMEKLLPRLLKQKILLNDNQNLQGYPVYRVHPLITVCFTADTATATKILDQLIQADNL